MFVIGSIGAGAATLHRPRMMNGRPRDLGMTLLLIHILGFDHWDGPCF